MMAPARMKSGIASSGKDCMPDPTRWTIIAVPSPVYCAVSSAAIPRPNAIGTPSRIRTRKEPSRTTDSTISAPPFCRIIRVTPVTALIPGEHDHQSPRDGKDQVGVPHGKRQGREGSAHRPLDQENAPFRTRKGQRPRSQCPWPPSARSGAFRAAATRPAPDSCGIRSRHRRPPPAARSHQGNHGDFLNR